MALDSNNFKDTMRRQHEITPPNGLAAEVEREVMGRILLPSRSKYRRFAIALVGGVLAVVVIMISIHHPAAPAVKPQFVESVVFLDDHLCIWLEPIESSRP